MVVHCRVSMTNNQKRKATSTISSAGPSNKANSSHCASSSKHLDEKFDADASSSDSDVSVILGTNWLCIFVTTSENFKWNSMY